MSSTTAESTREIVIEPQTGWRMVDLGEVIAYRDLLWNLTWRSIKARYAQSALGMGWVLVQPLATLLIYSLVFGRVVRVPVPGGVPYPLFAFCGMVPWLFFAGSMVAAGNSVVSSSAIVSKVYFPRLILPLSNILGRFVDLAATLLVLGLLLLQYKVVPQPSSLVIMPLLFLIAAAAALGMGLWLSAMAVQYRDVAHAMTFLSQLWMYLSPVIYPATLLPERYQKLYALNPMAGVISGFRSCVLGEPAMPWDQIAIGGAVSLIMLVTGAFYFRRCERLFADVV